MRNSLNKLRLGLADCYLEAHDASDIVLSLSQHGYFGDSTCGIHIAEEQAIPLDKERVIKAKVRGYIKHKKEINIPSIYRKVVSFPNVNEEISDLTELMDLSLADVTAQSFCCMLTGMEFDENYLNIEDSVCIDITFKNSTFGNIRTLHGFGNSKYVKEFHRLALSVSSILANHPNEVIYLLIEDGKLTIVPYSIFIKKYIIFNNS